LTFAVLSYILQIGGGVVVKTITIRVSDKEYKEIKVAVAEKGITLKDYILGLIRADLDSKKK
jgi:hypothetical protein